MKKQAAAWDRGGCEDGSGGADIGEVSLEWASKRRGGAECRPRVGVVSLRNLERSEKLQENTDGIRKTGRWVVQLEEKTIKNILIELDSGYKLLENLIPAPLQLSELTSWLKFYL